MLPQTLDFGATAYLSSDKARVKYRGRERENKIGKNKAERKIMKVLLKEGGENKDAGERSEKAADVRAVIHSHSDLGGGIYGLKLIIRINKHVLFF